MVSYLWSDVGVVPNTFFAHDRNCEVHLAIAIAHHRSIPYPCIPDAFCAELAQRPFRGRCIFKIFKKVKF